jgi:hypothetical protein
VHLPKRPDFETRLIVAICLFGSALVHALGVFLTYTPKQIPDAVTIEFIRPADEEPEEEPGLGRAANAGVDEAQGAGEAPAESSTGWRARWRAKEERYQRDLEAQGVNIALLDQTGRGPAGDDKPGAPLSLCDRSGARPVQARAERDVSHWGGLVPTGLFQAAYMDGMTQVTRGGARLGGMEFALPARRARVPLDEPANAVVEVGRADARCLIGISYSAGVFPIVMSGMPARLAVDGEVREAVVDVRLFEDGTFSVTDREGTLGVTRGAVYNHETLGRRLRTFYSGASLFIPR